MSLSYPEKPLWVELKLPSQQPANCQTYEWGHLFWSFSCCIEKHPKSKWLKRTYIFLQNIVFGRGLARIAQLWFTCQLEQFKACRLKSPEDLYSLGIDADCRLSVSSFPWENFSVVSLYGPFWTSSQHVWLVEEWISQETKLGRNCKDSEHSLRNHTSGIGTLRFKGRKYRHQLSMKCQYHMIRIARDGLHVSTAVYGKYSPPDYPRPSKPCWPALKLQPHE